MKNDIVNIPKGYKNSPLGIIPKEWEVRRLIDVCYNQGDYGVNAPAVPYEKDLPTYLRITDINDEGKFIRTNRVSVNITNSVKYSLKEGDIVFARTGATVGKTYLYNTADGDLVFAGFLIRFTPNTEKIFPYYIRIYADTTTYWNWVRIISQRSGQPGINAAEYCSLKIPVPSLTEQQKIIEVLSTWDKAIEKQSQLIEKLELRKKGLMQQLLTGKKRLPGFSGEWKNIKLGDISKRITRKNKKEECSNVVTISAQKGFVRQTDFFNKKVASEEIENYYLVNRNEFCYNKSYSNGFPMGTIKRLKEFDQAVVTTLYICFAIQEEIVSIDFIEQYFSLGLLNRGLMKVANEGGRAHGLLNVTPNDFFNIKLILPPYYEQMAISSILLNAQNEVVLAKRKLESLQEQKKGLMQVLLIGKKRLL